MSGGGAAALALTKLARLTGGQRVTSALLAGAEELLDAAAEYRAGL